MSAITRAERDELRRLHAEALANKGGDFEIECDEAIRLACMAKLPGLLDALDAAEAKVGTQFRATLDELRKALGGDIGSEGGLCAILTGIEQVKAQRDRAEADLAATKANLERAERALRGAGWQDAGGSEWKPPLGPNPSPLLGQLDALRTDLAVAKAKLAESDNERKIADGQLAALSEIHPFHHWGDDDGVVLWFCLPVSEPPFHVGTPDDSDWPWCSNDMADAKFTAQLGWSRLPRVNENIASRGPTGSLPSPEAPSPSDGMRGSREGVDALGEVVQKFPGREQGGAR